MRSSATDGARAVRIVHDIPGRLRVRLPDSADADAVAERVQALPGVQRATWSPRTRGLLVQYGDGVSADEIVGSIRDRAGGSLEPLSRPAAAAARRPTLGAAVAGAAGDLDGAMRRATGGTIRLGTLIPAALLLWAGREMLLGRVAPLGWSSALWYAHGLFRDYNTSPE